MMRVTGNGVYSDHIEKAAYNAGKIHHFQCKIPSFLIQNSSFLLQKPGAGSVNRTYLAHLYYQSPNLISNSDGIAWFDGKGTPGEKACHGDDKSGNCRYSRWTFGHFHLPPCCTGNQARMLPNFIQHMFFNADDAQSKTRGVAVSLYGPARADVKVGPKAGLVDLQLNLTTDYPFNEPIKLSVSKLASPTSFPLMLRVPGWCITGHCHATLTLNGKALTTPIVDANGFITLTRSWSQGDSLVLNLPMKIRATKRETFGVPHSPMSHNHPWTGTNATGGLPFCEVEVGALAFALPLEKTPAGPANYAIDCDASTMTLSRQAMPETFDWPLDAPITVKVKAQEITWPDVWLMPSAPIERDASAAQTELTLIPYGAAKQYKVSMFPYLK